MTMGTPGATSRDAAQPPNIRGFPSVALARLWAFLFVPACTADPCDPPDGRVAECRVLAEQQAASFRGSAGHTLRFVDPSGADADAPAVVAGWLSEDEDGALLARPAGFGRSALILSPASNATGTVEVRLSNVAEDADLLAGPPGAELPVPAAPEGLRRTVLLPLDAGAQRILIHRSFGPTIRLAATADIQTNPGQFDLLLDALHDEHDRGVSAMAPLAGLVVLGDLAEEASIDELRTVRALLDDAPVPTAVTPGNHDVYDGEDGGWVRIFGPTGPGFDVGPARIVLLDTGLGDLADSVEATLPERLDRRGADVLIAGMHYPPFAGRADQGFGDERTAQRLLAELARNDADLVLAGHIHDFRDYGRLDVGGHGIHEYVVGTGGADQGIVEHLFGFLRVEIGPAWTACFVETPPPGAGPHPRDDVPYCADTRAP